MEIYENERINEINENLRLIEKKDSLTFGTDAYLLSAFIPKRSRATMLELGGGSGVISLLLLSKEKCKRAYLVEVQADIFDVARRNGELNGLSDKYKAINKDLRELTVKDTEGEVDLVFSNPPYMKADSGKLNANENKCISRHEMFGDIDDFCKCAARMLKHGGDFCVVYRPDRMADLLYSMRANKIEPKKITFVHANTTTPPSLLLVSGKLGGKSGLTVTKPIYIYKDGTQEYTDEFKRIYEICETED